MSSVIDSTRPEEHRVDPRMFAAWMTKYTLIAVQDARQVRAIGEDQADRLIDALEDIQRELGPNGKDDQGGAPA